MASIEAMIHGSKCFGLAFDNKAKECRICEVKLRCESACRMGGAESIPDSVNIADDDEVSETEKAVEKTKAKESSKTAKKVSTLSSKKKSGDASYSEDMPDFKPMSMDEISQLLVDRGGDLSKFDKYSSDKIKRMRIIMAIKETYVK